MRAFERIAKNTLILMFSQVITKILGLFFIVYVARSLGDAGFGKYSFAFAFTILFSIFTDLGLNILTIREVARDKSKVDVYLGNIILIKLILGTITYGLIAFAINLMNYPPDTTMAVYIVALYTILSSFTKLFTSIFRAFERMKYEALITVTEMFIIVGLGMYVLFSGYGLIELVSAFLIASIFILILSYVICIRNFAKPKFEIDISFWKVLLNKSFPFALAAIFHIIYSKIDITMLSVMQGDKVVGWYSAAYVLIEGLTIIPIAFMGAIFPAISYFFKTSEESLKISYEKSFKFLFILALPIATGTTLLADSFILMFYGEEYSNSVVVLQILIWSLALMFLAHLLGTVLRAIDKQGLTAYVAGISAVLNVVLNLLLIPILGHIGAAIATLASEILVLVLYFVFVSRYLYKLPLLTLIVKPIIACFVMGVFIYYFKSIHLILLVLLAVSIYFLTLYLIKTFDEEDIGLIKSSKSHM